MKKALFIEKCLEWARQVEKQFELNPVVVLAQAAFESGWGQSQLSRYYHNFFGISAYGGANDFWDGKFVELGSRGLKFRSYQNPLQSFLDYGRLIRKNYLQAAGMSYHPEAFAKEIAYSRYIDENNGDDREQYRKSLISISRDISVYLEK